MSPSHNYDAVVIGGGISGLAAAAYLARSGKRTVVLEASNRFDGSEGYTVQALDPRLVKDLKLARRGLRFAVRDMPLVGLRGDGKHIVITRDVHATAASIAIRSARDAEAWPHFRRSLFDLARAMRPLWWDLGDKPAAGDTAQQLEQVARMGASAWLDSWFESDALKAMLMFDAGMAGVSVLEPGSALALVWCAAQELSGHQGAVAVPKGGLAGLSEALVAAAQAAGAELRTGARATRLLIHDGAVAGVELSSRETCIARIVLSTLPRQQTLFGLSDQPLVGLAEIVASERCTPALAKARIVLTLGGAPKFGGIALPPESRFILADKPENYVSAELAARTGKITDELPLAFTVPTAADASLAPPGQHLMSVIARPIPLKADGGTQIAESVIQMLNASMQDIAQSVLQFDVQIHATPRLSTRHMLANATSRIETPVKGLFLCGDDAEPVPAISGRAARLAAMLAMGGAK